jgi:hypothetical protein
MHPIIEREMAQARVVGPYRQADREPMARAASLTPHTRREKRRPGRAPARTAVVARRLLTSLSALVPSSTMPGAGYIRWPGQRGGVAMRRLGVIVALGALLGMLAGVATASPALARGPKWQFQPAEPFTLPATFCGFEVQVTAPVDKEYAKILEVADGSMTFLTTGSLQASFTNLETGKTITENVSGPAKVTVQPDGSLTALGEGHTGKFLVPADAARFGLPTVSVLAGALTESVAPDGTYTSLSLQGHVLVDVCAALR